MIYIIGLGEDGMTQGALNALKAAKAVLARSRYMPGYARLIETGVAHQTLDGAFAKARSMPMLARRIAQAVRAAEKAEGSAAYVTDAQICEDAAALLLTEHKNTEIFPAAAPGLKRARSASYTVLSAGDVLEEPYPSFATQYPLIVTGIPGRAEMTDIAAKLEQAYGGGTEVFLAGRGMPLRDTGRADVFGVRGENGETYSAGADLFIPGQPFLTKERYGFHDLLNVMKKLRGEGGCPWDRAQTHQSIRMNAVEEAYEFAEAIDGGDDGADGAMCEEAGDVLLQPVFHAQIAEEQGGFTAADMLSALCRKLIFRHSHIFGADTARDSAEALAAWEKNKALEKGQDTASKSVDGVAKAFPALMRAQKVQKRAAKAGFEFENDGQVYAKLSEEIGELKEAIASGGADAVSGEAGDLLFAAVNAVRRAGADAEDALARSTEKFIARFKETEHILASRGKTFANSTPEEADAAYREAKQKCKERQNG